MMTSDELTILARDIRKMILDTVTRAGAGHTGGSLSEVEILVALYFEIMNINPENPGRPERDRFILSKGHSSPGYYCTLARRGFFPEEKLVEFDRIDGMLQGHPCMLKTPGVDMTTGSLGQGLSAGIGMILGRDKRKMNFNVYVLMGDGELQEGQIWEAAMYAGVHRLKGLIGIVDYNKVQLAGTVKDTLELEPLGKKWEAFGWQVLECDGHDISRVIKTLTEAKNKASLGPIVVFAHTVKGKGVRLWKENTSGTAKPLMPRNITVP